MIHSLKRILVVTVFLVSWGCKEKIEYLPPLCETRNYGILLVKFDGLFSRHSISIKMPDNTVRKKFLLIRNTSDTLHLPPGEYVVDVAALDELGNEFISDFQTKEILKCSETNMEVPF